MSFDFSGLGESIAQGFAQVLFIVVLFLMWLRS